MVSTCHLSVAKRLCLMLQQDQPSPSRNWHCHGANGGKHMVVACGMQLAGVGGAMGYGGTARREAVTS